MTSPAYKIAQHLDSEGFGTWADDIHVAREPATPTEVITIYDEGGQDPDTDEQNVFRPFVQLRLRSENYNTSYEKLEQIRDNLIAASITDINEIWMQGGILLIEIDDNERYIFTMNFILLTEGT